MESSEALRLIMYALVALAPALISWANLKTRLEITEKRVEELEQDNKEIIKQMADKLEEVRAEMHNLSLSIARLETKRQTDKQD